MRILALAFVVGSVVACGSAPAHPIGNTASPPGEAHRLTLTRSGIGGLTAETPATLAGLRAIFPHLTVEPGQFELEDGPHTVFNLARGTTRWMQIDHADGRIVTVEITTSELATESGAAVGQDFADAAGKLGGVECFGMVEEEAGNAICWSKAATTIAMIVPIAGESEFYAQQIPPERVAQLFAGARVERLVWNPLR